MELAEVVVVEVAADIVEVVAYIAGFVVAAVDTARDIESVAGTLAVEDMAEEVHRVVSLP